MHVVSPIPYPASPIPHPLSSVEWQQVQPGQCPCELGKHFHWFSWLDVAWFWASHSKRVENAFAARLTATATAMSAIESICQAVSLSSSHLAASSSPSLCLRACLRLFARINDVIQLKWNFSHLTAHMQRQHGRMRQEDEAGAVWVDVAR